MLDLLDGLHSDSNLYLLKMLNGKISGNFENSAGENAPWII